jgi:hypothetical protein
VKVKFISTIVLVLFGLISNAQYAKQITVNLYPIIIENGRYFYDGRRVNFEEVVMPLISINDQKIDQKLKLLNTLKDIRHVVATVPLVIFLVNMSNQQQTVNSFNRNRNVLWVSVATVIMFDISISVIKKSTINRYNDIILSPSAQLSPHGFFFNVSIRY